MEHPPPHAGERADLDGLPLPEADAARPRLVPAAPDAGAAPGGPQATDAVGMAEPPRALRKPEGAWVAGVSTGIAEHLGWPVLLVRSAFVALGCMQLVGVFAYGLLWMLMPAAPPRAEAPGLESARRGGLRAARLPARRGGNRPTAIAVTLLGATGAMLATRYGGGPTAAFFWPLAFASAGVALVWRQADASTATGDGLRDRLLSGSGWPAMLRMGVGLGLVGVAVSMVAASQIGVQELPMVLGLSVLMLLGVTIAAAPWITRLLRSQRAAHERVLLEQARADMAAHLHDSVLQTLALIQRRADDPREVSRLARSQERDLRAWLYGDQVTDASLSAALKRAGAEIEDERGVDVDVVCVGDTPLDDRTQAVVQAAREAIMNAAKHSGASRIDVYGEVEDGHVEVFVRDRGTGFDMAAIGDDRMGVRRSILERMERHGGSARVRSAAGEGTEVTLLMEV